MAVQDGAEGQPVAERGGHVGDADISVALALLLAPQLQVLDGGHSAAPGRAACGSRGRVADGGRRRRGKGAGGGGPSRPPSSESGPPQPPCGVCAALCGAGGRGQLRPARSALLSCRGALFRPPAGRPPGPGVPTAALCGANTARWARGAGIPTMRLMCRHSGHWGCLCRSQLHRAQGTPTLGWFKVKEGRCSRV